MFSTHLGSTIRPVMALAPRTIVAGTEGNGAAQVGEVIDRKGFNSAVLAVPVSATLAADETVDCRGCCCDCWGSGRGSMAAPC